MAKTKIIRNKHGQETCGARKQSGELCAQTKIGPNGRCRFHGGASPPPGPAHPLWKNGRGSRFLKRMPAHLKRTYRRTLDDPNVLSLTAELGLLDARVSELLDKLSTGESAEMIELLSLKLSTLAQTINDEESDELDIDDVNDQIEKLHLIVSGIVRDRSTWNEIRDTIESRRKVSDTERRLLEAQQHAIDAVQLRSLVTFFMGSLREHVMPLEGGREAVLGISRDLRMIMTKDVPDEPGEEDLDPANEVGS